MRQSKSDFFQTQYFVDDRAEALGIRVLGCGYGRIHPKPDMIFPRTLDCYGLTYLVGGVGRFKSNSVSEKVVRPGHAWIVFPGEWHEYGPVEGAWEEYWFLFDGPTLRNLQALKLISVREALFYPGIQEELRGHFARSLRLATDPKGTLKKIPLLLFLILGEIMGEHHGNFPLVEDDPIFQARKMIREDPVNTWDMAQLAGRVGLGYANFRKQFKKKLGVAPVQFMIKERISLAMQYLSRGISMKDAAFRIGIEDPYYFSHLFKKVTGKSPREFVRTRTK